MGRFVREQLPGAVVTVDDSKDERFASDGWSAEGSQPAGETTEEKAPAKKAASSKPEK